MSSARDIEVYHPWATYVAACEEARQRGDRRVGTEHLVLALLREPNIEALLGCTRQRARAALDALDLESLVAVGLPPEISTPSLVERPLPARPNAKAVMMNRIKLTPSAKRALQEAGKPMRRGRRITPERLLGELLESRGPDPGAVLLDALDIDAKRLREQLESEIPG
jgi:uncharacterized protein (DUF433 family)